MVDIPIKTLNECIRRKEAHRARQKPINDTSEEAVAEKEHARDEALNVQTGSIVPDAVDKHPDGATTPNEKALPPPVIVLRQC